MSVHRDMRSEEVEGLLIRSPYISARSYARMLKTLTIHSSECFSRTNETNLRQEELDPQKFFLTHKSGRELAFSPIISLSALLSPHPLTLQS